MTLATERGRTYALFKLKERRKRNVGKVRVKNESLPAGAPMYFYCIGCGDDIVVPESYITKPDMCPECNALKRLGWME